MTWDARARSIGTLEADGEVSFFIPPESIGVAVGLATEEALGFDHFTHAVQVSKGQCRVLQLGRPVTGWRPATADRYTIKRESGRVTIHSGDSLLYASGTQSRGAVFAAAALMMPFDSVVDLEIINAGQSLSVRLPRPRVVFTGDSYPVARAPRPRVAVNEVWSDISARLPRPRAVAYDASSGPIARAPRPRGRFIETGITVEIIRARLRRPTCIIYSADGKTLHAPVARPRATIYDANSGPIARVRRPRAFIYQSGIPAGWRFDIVIPGFLTAEPASFDIEIGVEAEFSAFNDWSSLIEFDAPDGYVARLEDPAGQGEPLNLRISSWQSTVQLGRANYLQVVVPAAAGLMPLVESRSDWDLVVYRQALIGQGAFESEMARVPLGSAQLNQGAHRATLTLSGYGRQDVYPDYGERMLAEVQTYYKSGNSSRIRAKIDWWLRPGMTAKLPGGESVTVRYINYYVTTEGPQAYMDIGSADG
ncbi:MAG: hypothetical protein RBR77_04205 [Thauera sp.]|nr:hypothetical protein [Thauera sp.]